MIFNETKKVSRRNCFCSDDLDDLLSELVADYGDVDNFVLSLQHCRFIDNLAHFIVMVKS